MIADNAQVVDSLDKLLDEEREALISGQLDQIAELVERKTNLLSELDDANDMEAVALGRVREKLVRNQGLLEEAAMGIKIVASRLDDLKRVKSYLETYDADGARKTTCVATSGSVEKRA